MTVVLAVAVATTLGSCGSSRRLTPSETCRRAIEQYRTNWPGTRPSLDQCHWQGSRRVMVSTYQQYPPCPTDLAQYFAIDGGGRPIAGSYECQ